MTKPSMKRIHKTGGLSYARARTRITLTLPLLPDHGDDNTQATIVGNRIIFVTAMQDSDTENPCTSCDGFGSIRSLSSRHIDNISHEDAKELLTNDPDVIPLSYFEHGNSLWMVMHGHKSSTPGIEFQWDGVRFAGVWIPDSSVRESFTGQDGLNRREWMAKQAESACEVYTSWANGECYGYQVQTFKLRNGFNELRDYRHDTPEYEDSCYGFIGWEHFESEMRDSAIAGLKAIYTKQRYSKRAIASAFKGEK